jgi:hypothetical protein
VSAARPKTLSGFECNSVRNAWPPAYPRLAAFAGQRRDDHLGDGEAHAGRTNQRLERVRVPGDDAQPEQCLTRERAVSRCGVTDRKLDDAAEDPRAELVASATHGRDLRCLGERAHAHHHVCATTEDGGDQARDLSRIVLAVPVEVDDDVRAGAEGDVHPGPERGDQAPIGAMTLDVVGARGERDARRPVTRAVVDDDDLDFADLRQVARHRGDHRPDRARLVERRDDDRQLAREWARAAAGKPGSRLGRGPVAMGGGRAQRS